MKAIDPAFLRERALILESHLERIRGRRGEEPARLAEDPAAKDSVSLHLLLGVQVVLDLAIFACIHFGLQAPSSYDDAIARLEHAGYISAPLSDRLEKAANYRDAFVHASDQIDAVAIHRAAGVLPEALRAFIAEIARQV